MVLSRPRGDSDGADIAISLRHGEADDIRSLGSSRFMWNAWKRHHWPMDVVRAGMKVYGFDKQTRRFVVLLEITRGGAFTYRRRAEFVRNVKRLTGWTPWLSDPAYQLPPPPGPGKRNSALAIRWKVIKRVAVPWKGRFPQLGWLRISNHHGSELVDVDELSFDALEGAQRLTEHLRRERNRTLVARKKHQIAGRTGRLACEACGFDFATTYGPLGVGFAEVHHRTPLSQLARRRRTTLRDLAILCSNCHRMIHRTKPFQSVEVFQRSVRSGA